MDRRRTPALLALALALAAGGCGSDSGVSSGATVSVYVGAPLCARAKQKLVSEGGGAGSVRLRAICLPSDRDRGRLHLATVGANARRATEDSATIAYLEALDPAAARFTHPILESAEIGWVQSSSGAAAMTRLLRAVEESDSADLRDSVRESLSP